MVKRWIDAAFVAALWAAATGAEAAPPPVEAFGLRPAVIDISISPGGSRIAWIEDQGAGPRLVIHDLASRRILRTISVPPGVRLREVAWATDDTVLAEKSETRTTHGDTRDTNEWHRWIALDALEGPERVLLMNDGGRAFVTGASLIRAHTSRPGQVFMATLDFSSAQRQEEIGSRLIGGRKNSGWVWNLYDVSVKTGSGRVMASGTPFTLHWVVDATGESIVRSDWNPTSQEFTVYVKAGLNWRRIHRTEGCRPLTLLAFDRELTAVIARGKACGEGDRGKLWSIPVDGSAAKVLYEDADLDLEFSQLDPFDGTVLGVQLGGADPKVHWLDDYSGKLEATLMRSLGASSVDVVSRSRDGRRLVVLGTKASRPPVYYLVDFDAKSADILAESYPLLADVALGEVREFEYRTRDEYPLMGYLTMPPDAPARRPALVVMPHGGPEARDYAGFDWMSQFLVSRGYAVFQPQFRGSSGFGRAHADAGRRQWGLRMQDDVTDGVRALIAAGLVDASRICIVGWSYGGYSALAGAAFTPDLYACAASVAGISDLPSMLGYELKDLGRESNRFAYWRDHIGPATDPQVIARSPARSAATVRAPVLLLHGVDDTVVPVAQSRTMARALSQAGRPHQLVELPGDDHDLSASATRVRMLSELEKFLGTHLAAPTATN
jgi:dipeptidyl aminopeptidase/acylaminoacyl peptidase